MIEQANFTYSPLGKASNKKKKKKKYVTKKQRKSIEDAAEKQTKPLQNLNTD